MNWEKIWDTIVNFFNDNIWSIAKFFGVLIIGLIVVKILINIIKRILNRTHMEKISQNFITAIIKFLLYLLFVLVLLSTIGIEVTGILTAFSAALLAVGMALQNNIANLANGIVIVSNQMFKKGDYISVNGVEGSIQEINFLFTTIVTADNKRITIPNSDIVNNPVTNSGAHPKRRVDFTFSVAYETDVELVKKIVKDVMISNGKVYLDPTPFCRLKTLASSSIDFFANCWVDSSDYWDVYYYVIENVYNEFKRNNISIPYNQLEIRQRTDKITMPVIKTPLPNRVEKTRKENKKKFDLEDASLTDIIKEAKKNKKKTKKEQ
ncbi:MAG: mechanosensitive ion channel [Erysipelotrichaceae bacterium]|nr:mechanosensitive ion channel [Erysipelotrichaceae bacterium]